MTEVDIIDGNISKEIVFNSSNEWISTSWDVRRNELPETVTHAIASSEKYAGYQIDDADFVETPDEGEYYLVELEKGEWDYPYILYCEDGRKNRRGNGSTYRCSGDSSYNL